MPLAFAAELAASTSPSIDIALGLSEFGVNHGGTRTLLVSQWHVRTVGQTGKVPDCHTPPVRQIVHLLCGSFPLNSPRQVQQRYPLGRLGERKFNQITRHSNKTRRFEQLQLSGCLQMLVLKRRGILR